MLLVSTTVQRLSPQYSPRYSAYLGKFNEGAILASDIADSIIGHGGEPRIKKVSATFVVLARNSNLEGLAGSIRQAEERFNHRYHYDWVFFNDEEFTDEFKNVTSSIVSGTAHYGLIPKAHWSIPSWIDEDKAAQARVAAEYNGVGYGGSLSYRHMCRFNSGFFFRHPLLQQYEYYWRVEPDVSFYCDLTYDPFKFMQDNGKKYGFVISFEEFQNTMETLWDSVGSFIAKYPQHISPNNSMAFLSEDEGKTYTRCHFVSPPCPSNLHVSLPPTDTASGLVVQLRNGQPEVATFTSVPRLL